MKTFPIRLIPSQDLRAALEVAEQPTRLTESMEIPTLSGTVAVDGGKSSSHLHMAVSTATGQVLGAHVAYAKCKLHKFSCMRYANCIQSRP